MERGKSYLEARRIDPKQFYFAERFKEFANSHRETFADTTFEESRIIIPLYQEKQLIGFQGRALGPNSVKYITVMLDDNAPKIYGLDNVRKDAPVYVTEGPFDSTFISNAIAMCGADADVRRWGIDNPVYVYDNEPRNREIVKRIQNCIERGESVIIWPNTIKEKDINDMVLAGHDVMSVLKSNTCLLYTSDAADE